MEKDNTHQFLPFEQTKAELEAAGLKADKEILVYCGTSREGSLLRFYLRHVAKFPNTLIWYTMQADTNRLLVQCAAPQGMSAEHVPNQ